MKIDEQSMSTTARTTWRVLLTDQSDPMTLHPMTLQGHQLHLEGGVLYTVDRDGRLLTALAAHAWIEVTAQR